MEDSYGNPKRGNSWGQVLAVGFVILVLGIVFLPVVMKTNHGHRGRSEAVNNAKQIYYLLVEFDCDYGQFPTDATAVDGMEGCRGEYSNDYLTQFFDAGYTNSEEIFYARGGSGVDRRQGDYYDDRDPKLEAGECGFAYIKDLSSKSHPETPVLLSPMFGDGYKFNSDVHDWKAIYLRVDGTVKTSNLTNGLKAKIGGGKTLFEGGKDSVWGEEGFDASKLRYAKGTYQFTPRPRSLFTRRNVMMSIVGVIIVLGISRVIIRSRKRAKAHLAEINTKP